MSLVVFAGNIGSGKTTAAAALASRLKLPFISELIEENPYLSAYYNNMQRWAFNLATFNLQDRARQLIKTKNEGCIIDRSIYEDRYIFVRLQREYGFIGEDDFSTYCHLWDLIVPNLRTPDLLVFLDSPIDLCVERIKIRNRSIETNIPYKYLISLEEFYSDWIKSFDDCPILHVNIDKVDYIEEANIVDRICKLI